jgi:hypothetical protein
MLGQKGVCIAATVIAVIVIGGIACYYPSQQRIAVAQVSSNANNPVTSSIGSAPTPLPADIILDNRTYGEWTAKWWQWLVSIPEDRNPAADETGQNCGEAQSGSVWFLVGTFGGGASRACNIPAGMSLLFSVLNAECSYAEYPDLRTESELRSCAVSSNDAVTELMVIIDGQAIDNSQLRSYRVQSPIFDMTLPENNIFGLPAGTTQAVSDGFWVFLPPLEPGSHVIHFRGAIVDFTVDSQNNFVQEVIYHITVA